MVERTKELSINEMVGSVKRDIYPACEIIMDHIVLISKTPIKNRALGSEEGC